MLGKVKRYPMSLFLAYIKNRRHPRQIDKPEKSCQERVLF
jgi:hypothetical protein